MFILFALLLVFCVLASTVSAQYEAVYASANAKLAEGDLKGASAVFKTGEKQAKKARDKDAKKQFKKLQEKCSDLNSSRYITGLIAEPLEEGRILSAYKLAVKARKRGRAGAKISAEGFDELEGEIVENAEASYLEVNTIRTEKYTAHFEEADRLLAGKQYTEAIVELNAARAYLTELEQRLHKIDKKVNDAKVQNLIKGVDYRIDKGEYLIAVNSLRHAQELAGETPIPGLSAKIDRARSLYCAELPDTFAETAEQFYAYGDDALSYRRAHEVMACDHPCIGFLRILEKQKETIRSNASYYNNAIRYDEGEEVKKEYVAAIVKAYRAHPSPQARMYIGSHFTEDFLERYGIE